MGAFDTLNKGTVLDMCFRKDCPHSQDEHFKVEVGHIFIVVTNFMTALLQCESATVFSCILLCAYIVAIMLLYYVINMNDVPQLVIEMSK